MKNTLILNLGDLIIGFPIPIFLAIFLNELRSSAVRKATQTLLYLPNFLSWVIISGIVTQLLSASGLVNNILNAMGIESVAFLSNSGIWRFVYWFAGVWQGAGYSLIVYLASLMATDASLGETAYIDGATRLQRIWHVTLPQISSTITVLLIMQIGKVVTISFGRPYMMGNTLVKDASDVISTYVYSVGLAAGRFDFATAVGLFQTVVGVILVLSANKEELGEYLYAVKDAGLGTPWAMSGRGDTEKMYLNFVGSYVPLEDERKAYIYNEAYMAMAPEAKEGLKTLNQWYNDGLITQEFPTDTDESAFLATVANGEAGFVLDDTTHIWDSTQVLNNAVGHETFVPIMCFELPDGTYRTPYEFRHAMYVMIPAASADKAEACMKYLNWMADPAVAVNIRYTPDHETDENGVALDLTAEQLAEKGYPGTPDDLGIMNLNFDWVNDYDLMAQVQFKNQATEWATVDWFKNYYTICNTGKYIFPSYGYISEDEQTYGADVKTRMISFVYTCICCPSDQFESTYESGYNELVNAGLQKILDARAAYYDSLQ